MSSCRLRGGDFATPVDDMLAALGLRRNVVLSAASFLFVQDIAARSDLVARSCHSASCAIARMRCGSSSA